MARIVNPPDLFDLLNGIISSKKQSTESPYVDLTVGKLYRQKTGGKMDFGGSEFVPAASEPCLPVKIKPDDAYGWWILHEGNFWMELNEAISLPENCLGFIQPHPNLQASGCWHPTLTWKTIDHKYRLPLWIPKYGLHLKQNSRVSRIVVMEL